MVAPDRDGDGQPTHLRVAPSNGAHVAESDAAWLWQLIRDAQKAPPAGPDPDERVWLRAAGPGEWMHEIPRGAAACGWDTRRQGVTVLAREATSAWGARPCPRCWPGAAR